MGICSVEGCGKVAVARGLCATHYKQMRRNGSISSKKRYIQCKIEGCGGKHYSRGFCMHHYNQFIHHTIDEEGHLIVKVGK